MIQKLDQLPAKSPIAAETPAPIVLLVDGSSLDLSRLTVNELLQLQWDQERAFADLIKKSAKGSAERTDIIQRAYATVCQILATISAKQGKANFVMGMDVRYKQLVLEQLAALEKTGVRGGLFELGFGSGTLLQAASEAGFRVGGLEVADQLYQESLQRIPEQEHENLVLGNFLENDRIESLASHFSLVYWNDVFEHIPVDEIEDYLARIHQLLVPGGRLITITPNWHMRPMDVTADHLPGRSTAVGFHLKEYTLSEVCRLLSQAGFSSIHTPFFVGRKKIFEAAFDLTAFKRIVEPALEWIPYPLAVQVCRRFGFCLTIATRR
jgi:SAM-dependent methyltransferase